MQAMQENAAVFRTGSVLKEGCEKIANIYSEFEDIKVNSTKIISKKKKLENVCNCLKIK